MRPRLLDLFCGAGGAAMGYHRAGFDVVGVDINPQPHYPFEFYEADVFNFAFAPCEFDAIHASPPCQAYSDLKTSVADGAYPKLIEPVRSMLCATGLPYIIENVEGAPLVNPVTLCGGMFPGLRVYRHRLFESNLRLTTPDHQPHAAPLRKMGRRPQPGDFMHVVGNFSGVEQARRAMGIDWMSRDELREAIPPAFTEYLGRQLLAHLSQARAA